MKQSTTVGLTHEQINLCSQIGETTSPLTEKLYQMFSDLNDPLLSISEIRELLGTQGTEDEYTTALKSLCADDLLEFSISTKRPLDGAENIPLYRRKKPSIDRLKIIAMESSLPDLTKRYQFTCDGRVIRSLAKVHRLDAISGDGQQRDEIKRHVTQIAAGIENGNNIPNAILLTLNSSNCIIDPEEEPQPESFVIVRGISEQVDVLNPFNLSTPAQSIRTVELDFPFRPAAFDEEKVALLVDGQQRTAALTMVDVEKVPSVALSVIAVVADASEAKKVFQIANNTQKITVEFSRALLASMDDQPSYLQGEQGKARTCRLLALDNVTSPFKGIVRYPGIPASKNQFVAYNSLFQIVTTFADCALNIGDDAPLLASTIEKSFRIVKDVWPEAWNKKPGQSRLMHGAGLRAVAALCSDSVTSAYRQYFTLEAPEIWEQLSESLKRLRTVILWDDATVLAEANKAQAKNYREHIANVQNTSQDIRELTQFLLKESMSVDKAATKKK